MFSDIDNIHAIIRTCEKTMPNTEAIWKGLRETNVKDAIPVDVVPDALNAFKEFYPEQTNFEEQFANSLCMKLAFNNTQIRTDRIFLYQ